MNRMQIRWLPLLLAAVLLLSVGAYASPAVPESAPAARAEGKVSIIVELEEPKAFPMSLFSGRTLTRAEVQSSVRRAVPEAEMGYDYDVLLRGFSLKADASDLEKIQRLDGVRSAYIAETYTVTEPEGGWGNAATQAAVGAQRAHAMGYTGKGMVIAVLDTGLALEHEAFSGPVAEPRLSESDIDSKLASLHAGEDGATAEMLSHGDKIAFAYNYYDRNTDLSDLESHGTHVTGIAAANGGEILGVAPDAQVLFMKVFDGFNHGGEDAILAALEDAVTLGADCVNMSLGTPSGFSAYPNETQERVYENLAAAGIEVIASAGNEGFYPTLGWPNPLFMPDSATADNPGTYPVPLAVANLGLRFYGGCRVGEETYLMVDAGTLPNAPEGLPGFETLRGETLPLIDCGDGHDIPSAVQGAAAFIDVSEYWTAYENLCAAAVAQGAKMVVFRSPDIFWENETMNYSQGVTVPVVFLRQSDAEQILRQSEPSISYVAGVNRVICPDPSSAWGPTSDLKLKPEIAGIGMSVYSSIPDDTNAYETKSGTSMAAPQLSGAAAVLNQFLRDQKLKTPLTGRQLAETLLMNTATPAENKPLGEARFVSPRQQGAGMANVADAIAAKAYLTVPGSERPKAELGAGDGPFTFSFTAHNLTDAALTYRLEVQALAQDQKDGAFDAACRNYAGKGVEITCDGAKNGQVTVPAGGETTLTITLTPTAEFLDAMAGAENGFFLDGFVRLFADSGCGSDLGLPYLAFVGDWSAAPVLDLDGMKQKPELYRGDDTPLGSNRAETRVVTDENGVAEVQYYVDPDAASISPSAAEHTSSFFQSQTVLLRNAERAVITFADSEGREIVHSESGPIRRSNLYADEPYAFTLEQKMQTLTTINAYDPETWEPLPEGWYTYTVSADLSGGERTDSWSRRVYIDPCAPEMEWEITGEGDARKLVLTVTDNFRLSYFSLGTVDAGPDSGMVLAISDVGVEENRYADVPGVEQITRDGERYTLTLDLSAFLAAEAAAGRRTDALFLQAWDYADNTVSEILPMAEDFYPVRVELNPPELYLSEDETCQVQARLLPEGSPHQKITWESMDPSIAVVDEDGRVTGVSPGNTWVIAKAEAPEGELPAMSYCVVMVMEPFNPGYEAYKIQFDPMGGVCPIQEAYTIEAEGQTGVLLSLPPCEREGYTFLGWFTEPEGGEQIEDFHVFTADTVLYAHWQSDTEPTPPPDQQPCDGGASCPSAVFTDVDRGPDSWYHLALDWAVTSEITAGTSPVTFSPGETCTRAQIVTFLWRAAGKPAPEKSECPFRDVKESAYYRDAVLWAVERGITVGVSADRFDPNGLCTRAQIVTFLHRYAGSPEPAGENPFTDVKSTDWFFRGVLWAAETGVTQGKSKAAFVPAGVCTRAEAVTFLARASGENV